MQSLMICFTQWLLVIILLLPYFVVSHEGHHDEEIEVEKRKPIGLNAPVLLISMDGFRFDYLDKLAKNLSAQPGKTNYFAEIMGRGVWAPEGIRNAFTTVTFPNHYSIATGLYEENHGIVGSVIYDPVTDKTYNLPGDDSKVAAALYGGEPMWNTYSKQKGNDTVACYMWVGCSIALENRPPIPHQVKYEKKTIQDRVSSAIRWISGGMKLVLLYFDEPDHTGHSHGPDSHQIVDMLLQLNSALGSLIEGLGEKGFGRDNLNIVLTSDHGMVSFNETVTMNDRPDLFIIRTTHYALWMVKPLKGKEQESFDHFKQYEPSVTVYWKKDLPSRWHFSNSPRVSPIVVVGRLGAKLTLKDPKVEQIKSVMEKVANATGMGSPWIDKSGGHGYDNRNHEMRPMFMAAGPAFKQQFNVSGTFHNVDIYLLVCKLLGLTPAPNNGTEALVESLLLPQFLTCMTGSSEKSSKTLHVSFLVIAACVLGVFVFTLTFYVLHRKQEAKSVNRFNSVNSVSKLGNGVTYHPLLSKAKEDKNNAFPIPIPSGSDDSEDDLFK